MSYPDNLIFLTKILMEIIPPDPYAEGVMICIDENHPQLGEIRHNLIKTEDLTYTYQCSDDLGHLSRKIEKIPIDQLAPIVDFLSHLTPAALDLIYGDQAIISYSYTSDHRDLPRLKREAPMLADPSSPKRMRKI